MTISNEEIDDILEFEHTYCQYLVAQGPAAHEAITRVIGVCRCEPKEQKPMKPQFDTKTVAMLSELGTELKYAKKLAANDEDPEYQRLKDMCVLVARMRGYETVGIKITADGPVVVENYHHKSEKNQAVFFTKDDLCVQVEL